LQFLGLFIGFFEQNGRSITGKMVGPFAGHWQHTVELRSTLGFGL
jgi:hypothetical protein